MQFLDTHPPAQGGPGIAGIAAKAKKSRKVGRSLKAAAKPASKKGRKPSAMNVERRRRNNAMTLRREAAALGAIEGMGRGARGAAAREAAAVEAAEAEAAAAAEAAEEEAFLQEIAAMPEHAEALEANARRAANVRRQAEIRAAISNLSNRFGAMDIGTLHGPRNDNGLTPWNRHRNREVVEGTGMRIVGPGEWGGEEHEGGGLFQRIKALETLDEVNELEDELSESALADPSIKKALKKQKQRIDAAEKEQKKAEAKFAKNTKKIRRTLNSRRKGRPNTGSLYGYTLANPETRRAKMNVAREGRAIEEREWEEAVIAEEKRARKENRRAAAAEEDELARMFKGLMKEGGRRKRRTLRKKRGPRRSSRSRR